MHNRRRESGQALCEFALTLPILMALVLGVIELGYALFQTQLVTSMARECCAAERVLRVLLETVGL